MENKSIPPFYVGQEVVAVKDHSHGLFSEGDRFKVTRIFMGCCTWKVTIGLCDNNFNSHCRKCGNMTLYYGANEIPFKHSCFAPITSQFKTIEYSSVLEKEKETVGAN